MSYWRFLLIYCCGLAEGMLTALTAAHHWSAWPGAIWLLLPVSIAVTVYTMSEES